MNLLQELIQILNKRKCKCFIINPKTLTISYINNNNNHHHCSTLNSSISEITVFLLLNNIDYKMNEKKDIELLINQNELQTYNKDFKFHSISDFKECKY
jgi:hypothetical protein